MNRWPFWKLFVFNYLGITVVAFIFFDLIPTMEGNQAFGIPGLTSRIPVALAISYLTYRLDRRTRRT